MRRFWSMGSAAFIALAVSAIAAGPASAAKLTLSEDGTALAPGDVFEAYGDESPFVSTSSGEIECPYGFVRNGIELAVETNSASKDELKPLRLYGGSGEVCRSFTGNAWPSLESLGGPVTVRANNKASAGPSSLAIEFEHVTYKEVEHYGVDCVYSTKHLSGFNTATATRQPLVIELEGKLKLDRSSSSPGAEHLCPKTAEVGLRYAYTESSEREYETIEEQV